MKTGLRILFISAAVVLLAGCASRTDMSSETREVIDDEVVTYENCMPAILKGRTLSGELPPAASFAGETAGRIFSCEYFRGEKIKVFGHVVRLGKRPIYSGYGYVLADKGSVVNELISSVNILPYYKDLNKKVKVKIKKDAVHLSKFDKNVPLYFIKGSYLGFSRTIAALSILDFEQFGREHTLFLWVQGSNLTAEGVVNRFRKAVKDLIVPDNLGS